MRVEGEPDLIAMTPTSMAYDAMEPDDICIVTTTGELVEGRREPTSELPLHTLVYARRPEVGRSSHASAGGNDDGRPGLAPAADPLSPASPRRSAATFTSRGTAAEHRAEVADFTADAQ